MSEEALKKVTVEASGDLSSSQYLFVTVNSSNQAAVAGAGAKADGVLQDKPAAQGRAACVGTNGRSKIVCGADLSSNVGAELTSDASGRAVVATTGDYIMGTLTIAGSAAGEIGEMLVEQRGVSD